MPKPGDSAILNDLDASAMIRLQKVLPALALIYLVASATSLFARPLETGLIPGCLAYTTATVFLSFRVLGRRNWIPPRRVFFVASISAVLILAGSLVRLSVAFDTAQFAVIVLLLIGSAATLLSRRCFALIAILSLAGWLAVAAEKLSVASLAVGTLVLLTTAVLTGAAIWVRIEKECRVREARRAEQESRRQERIGQERFTLAVEGTNDGLWYWDLNAGAMHFSPSWGAMLGYQPKELSTNPDEWFSRVHPGYLAELRATLAAHIEGDSPQFLNQHRMLTRDGNYVWMLARGSVVRDEAGVAVGVAGSHADITALIEVENRLLNDAFHDKLTDLPNRHFMMGRLETAIGQRRDRPNRPTIFAVVFLDLDRFKVINDSLGHLVGDQLLVAVAGRLRKCARPSDVVSRFGGDEFVILLDQVRDAEEAMNIARRIQGVLSEPFRLGDREVSTGGSIGVALSSESFDKAEDVIRYADIAMYHAKKQRTGQAQMFNPGMLSNTANLCDLQNDLRRALERQQLVLYYQPYIAPHSGKIHGVEALIRWRRSENDLLLPGAFVPLAEEMGLIGEIGEWALRAACTQNHAWQQAGLPPMRMAVNLSPRQLQQPDFPQSVLRVLEETKLPSRWLELELTETALMDNLDLAPKTLEQLGNLGIRTAIDDFGTGYSSLSYLRRFNFQALKMDRSFVSDVTTDGRAAAIAKGLISLAHNLDLAVIAEGVERKEQLVFLAEERCDMIQGFLASRPAPPDELEKLLRGGDLQRRISRAEPVNIRTDSLARAC